MNWDKRFILCGVAYGLVGMILGIVMAASKDHSQHVTHAHILLVGMVLSMLYGFIHRLWCSQLQSVLKSVQFYLHQLGTIVMCISLFLAYGNRVSFDTLEPVLALSSIAVFVSLLLIGWMVLRSK